MTLSRRLLIVFLLSVVFAIWNLYSRTATQGHWVMAGKTVAGDVIDAWHGGGPLVWAEESGRPAMVEDTWLWRRYSEIAAGRGKIPEFLRSRLAKSVCRRWNGEHPGSDRLDRIKIYFFPRHSDRHWSFEYSCVTESIIPRERKEIPDPQRTRVSLTESGQNSAHPADLGSEPLTYFSVRT